MKHEIIKYTIITAFIWLPIAIILLYTLKNWIYDNSWRAWKIKYEICSRFKRKK